MKNLKIAVLGLMVVFLPWFVPNTTLACTCAPQEESNTQAFKEAGMVFAGKVTSFTGSDIFSNGGLEEIKFDISQTWKGANTDKVTIYTSDNSASCGWTPESGKEYLIYATEGDLSFYDPNKKETGLFVSICSRTFELADAGNDLALLNQTNPESTKEIPAENKLLSKLNTDNYKYFLVAGLLAGISFVIYKIFKKS